MLLIRARLVNRLTLEAAFVKLHCANTGKQRAEIGPRLIMEDQTGFSVLATSEPKEVHGCRDPDKERFGRSP
jgi:hypothetical protein